MKLLVFICLVGTTFHACTKKDESLKLGEDLTIKYGQTLVNEDLGLKLTLDSVINDSRCPLPINEIICTWEGDAEAHFTLKINDEVHALILHTTLNPKEVKVGQFKTTLIQVNPYPMVDVIIKPTDYQCVVRVDKQ